MKHTPAWIAHAALIVLAAGCQLIAAYESTPAGKQPLPTNTPNHFNGAFSGNLAHPGGQTTWMKLDLKQKNDKGTHARAVSGKATTSTKLGPVSSVARSFTVSGLLKQGSATEATLTLLEEPTGAECKVNATIDPAKNELEAEVVGDPATSVLKVGLKGTLRKKGP